MILEPRPVRDEPPSEALLRVIKSARQVCALVDADSGNKSEAWKVRAKRIRELNVALLHLDQRMGGRPVEDLVRRVMIQDLNRAHSQETEERRGYRWDDF